MTRVYAHRGDARAAKENTLEAFLGAVAAGAHGVELDVRRSADGALVVHHDAAVEGLGPISELRVRDLPGDVALLDEVLDVLAPLLVNVEIKNDPDEPGYDPSGSISHDVVGVLDERGDLDRMLVSSFDLATLDAVRQADVGIATGWLLGYVQDPIPAVAVAVSHGLSAVHPFVLAVSVEVVERAHGAGLDVNTWTVNARHDLEAMVAIGVDAVITDDIVAALGVLEGAAPLRNGGSGPLSA